MASFSYKRQSHDDEELVQIVHTSLVKSKNNSSKKFKKVSQESLSSNKFDILGVIVSDKLYHFSSQRLYDQEPDNTLMNSHSGEYKKRVKANNHIIEYLEPMQDFNLVIDYINGYNPNEFHLVFQLDYPRIEDFKIMVSELGFTNLLKIMDYSYPLANINGLLVNLSRQYIRELEPECKILELSNESECNVFTHFRDRELFREYLLEYIQGKKTRKQTTDRIIAKLITPNTNIETGIETGIETKIKIENKTRISTNNYILAKLKRDLCYFGFNILHNAVISAMF
jgi:hypothetical protein